MRTCILQPNLTQSSGQRDPEDALAEALSLVQALDVDVVDCFHVNLSKVNAGQYFGSGKVEELKTTLKALEIDLVVLNGTLSPVQQRNLERSLKVKVLDRTALILEIFGKRARTKEGVVVKTRELHRKSRKKVPYPIVALVGYTNAGKSSIFNKLTGASVLEKDMVFATLDPTMRAIELPSGRRVILSDTVGFISDLPTQLVAAFRATLEEVLDADLLLHVRDIAHDETDFQSENVDLVLKELGIPDEQFDDMIEVWNKSDLLDPETYQSRQHMAERNEKLILTSAISRNFRRCKSRIRAQTNLF